MRLNGGHHLIVTEVEDPDSEPNPSVLYQIECVDPASCNGWIECDKPHEVDGMSAADGPWDSECPGVHGADTNPEGHYPWCDEDEFEFHGVWHTWHQGHGWTVPYPGCVVAGSEHDYPDGIPRKVAAGDVFLLDEEWDDTWLTLTVVGTPGCPLCEDRKTCCTYHPGGHVYPHRGCILR